MALCLGQAGAVDAAPGQHDPILVNSVAALQAALVPENTGRRMTDMQGPGSDNHVDLRLRGLWVHTPDAPGDNNTLSVHIIGTTASGARDNV
jgi:hypothetical protein